MKNKLLIIELLQEYERSNMITDNPCDIYYFLTEVMHNKVNQQTALMCTSVYRCLCNV